VRFHLDLIAWAQGDDARARDLLRDAVSLNDRAVTPVDAIDALRSLGLIACAAGDLDEAGEVTARYGRRWRRWGGRLGYRCQRQRKRQGRQRDDGDSLHGKTPFLLEFETIPNLVSPLRIAQVIGSAAASTAWF
jgi:hypothetical protein